LGLALVNRPAQSAHYTIPLATTITKSKKRVIDVIDKNLLLGEYA